MAWLPDLNTDSPFSPVWHHSTNNPNRHVTVDSVLVFDTYSNRHTIDPLYRGRHYAAQACLLLFRLAKKHGMDHLFITCTPDNIASARTCELAGGQFVEVADIPEDNEMYAEGKRQVRVYKFDL